MSQELLDEITSINAIYSPSTLLSLPEDLIYSLTLPSLPSISFRLSFPPDYPDAPPSILGTQTVGNYVAKGEGAVLVDLIRGVLSDVYTPGAPCIFDLIQESGERLHKHGMDQSHAAVGEKPQAPEANAPGGCGRHSTVDPLRRDYGEKVCVRRPRRASVLYQPGKAVSGAPPGYREKSRQSDSQYNCLAHPRRERSAVPGLRRRRRDGSGRAAFAFVGTHGHLGCNGSGHKMVWRRAIGPGPISYNQSDGARGGHKRWASSRFHRERWEQYEKEIEDQEIKIFVTG